MVSGDVGWENGEFLAMPDSYRVESRRNPNEYQMDIGGCWKLHAQVSRVSR